MGAFTTKIDIDIELTRFESIVDEDNKKRLELFSKAVFQLEEAAKTFCDVTVFRVPTDEVSKKYYRNDTALRFSTVQQNSLSNNVHFYGRPYRSLPDVSDLTNFYSRIMNLVTACNIVFPGIVGVYDCKILLDNATFSTIELASQFSLLQILASDFPRDLYEKNISILEAYRWVNGIEKNGFESKTLLGRSIGAFNRLLFSNKSRHEHIMWLVLALEALFCSESTGYKAELLRNNSKKINCTISGEVINEIYKTRSEFLHGSTDFELYPQIPSAATLNDQSKPWPKNQPIFDAMIPAFQLLIQAFQYMVQHDMHELSFSSDSPNQVNQPFMDFDHG